MDGMGWTDTLHFLGPPLPAVGDKAVTWKPWMRSTSSLSSYVPNISLDFAVFIVALEASRRRLVYTCVQLLVVVQSTSKSTALCLMALAKVSK